MARSLVLDRSYLQAAQDAEIHRLCEQYLVLMPEALILEMLTAQPDEIRLLFKRLPDRDNPVALVPPVGFLMRRELETAAPSSPAETLALQQRFQFNAALRTGAFRLNEKQAAVVTQWRESVASTEREFLNRYACVQAWFPELTLYHAGQPPDLIEAAKQRVCDDTSFVAGIYDEVRPRTFPATTSVNRAWAVFRWLQVQLLYALEYVRRHGPGRTDLVGKRLRSDVIDSEYVVTALLADALASDDKVVKRMYQCLKPHGELLSNQ